MMKLLLNGTTGRSSDDVAVSDISDVGYDDDSISDSKLGWHHWELRGQLHYTG